MAEIELMSAEPQPKNPFKGLRPFQQNEELFGRDRDLILMKDRILSSRTTLLFAGSGVGKTSFLNAKIIPAFRDRYCVISHNRWTGSDGKRESGSWDDRPRFKILPPKAFGKWLSEAVFERAWLHRRVSKAKIVLPTAAKNRDAPPPSEEEIARRKVEASVQSVIAQSLRAGDKKRLSQELAAFKKRPPGEAQPTPCILILDQFEEIFQYHAFEDYFREFVSDLAKIINNDDYLVRIVFSMREEFLGELSAFDNHIPDLFNNYYRLRHPEIDEAKDIITKTCWLGNVKPHFDNLDKLVNDLASIQKNFEVTNQPDTNETPRVRVLRRDFVPPPYLQIVCDSLWKEQYEIVAATGDTATNAGTKQDVRLFLENYKAGLGNPVEGEESDAQRAVRVFCESKLSAPFLKKWEQSVAARAFGFLVTKQGAKMAYELRSLASHMDERVWALKHVLHKLSQPEARILRESRGSEGSYWYELYHDMYAGVVDRWKRRFRREQRRRAYSIVGLAVIAAVILPLLFIYWIKVPYDYRQTLLNYRDTLSSPEVEKDPDRYAAALVAYNQLRSTFGYSGTANLLWAQIWERRAQLYEAKQLRDRALMCLLQAAALVKDRSEATEYLAQANNLFLGNEESIRATFCNDCRVANVSPRGEFLLTISNDGVVNLWGIEKLSLISTLCVECDQAAFSADSQNVATVGSLKQIVNRPNPAAERPQASTSAPERNNQVQPKSETSNGWTITISSVESGLPVVSFNIRRSNTGAIKGDEPPPRFLLRSVAKTEKSGFLIAGVVDNRLKMWREDGSVFADLGAGTESESGVPAIPRADFDPNTRFLAAGRFPSQTKLWSVTPNGLLPSKITDLSYRPLYAFSGDGRYFLAATAANQVALWELAKQTEVFRIPVKPNRLFSLGFGVGSGKFYVSERDNSIRVWNIYSDKHEPIFEPLNSPRDFSRVLLDSEGKNVVVIDPGAVSKWSLESRSLIGELQIPSRQIGGALTADGSYLGLFDSSVRLWNVPALSRQDTFGGEAEEQASFEGLTSDGVSMLTMFQNFGENKPTSFRIWNLPQKTKVEFSAEAVAFAMSSDPVRLAVIPDDDRATIQIFDGEGKPQNRLSFDVEIKSITFNQSKKLLAAVTNTNEVRLIDTSTFQTLRNLKSDLNIASVVFAPNGEYLLIKAAFPVTPAPSSPRAQADVAFESFGLFDSFPNFEVWSLSRFDRVSLKRDSSEPVQFAGFGSNRLFTIENRRLEVWDLLAAKKILEVPTGEVAVAAMSADDNLVAIGSENGTLQFVNVTRSDRNSSFTLGGPVQKIIFAPDGKSVIATTDSWLHNFALTTDTVRYSQAIFATNAVPESVRILHGFNQNWQRDLPYIQWVRQGRGGWEVRQSSFDGRLSQPFLIGDPEYLLQDWSRRLGLQIQSNGYLAPNVPQRSPLISPSTF